MKTSNRIPALDGWRGLAILLVTVQHVAIATRFRYQIWANLGALGVDIFFVVSGYIITLYLIREIDGTSTIDIGSFYLRRAFRILPLVYVYLTVMLVLSA